MTEAEYQKLSEQHTPDFVDKCIEVLNNYKLSNGKRYKSDYFYFAKFKLINSNLSIIL